MENFESAKASKERANEGGGVGEYTRVSSAYTRTCLFLRIFARTLNIIIKKSYYNFVSLTLSLSLALVFYDVDALFVSRPSAFFMYSPFTLSFSLSFSLFLSLSYTHSLVHLLNKLPPLSPCLHLINTKNVYSTPSILSSTSMYNCRKRSMFSSLVSQ
jgi:hypothetical protein